MKRNHICAFPCRCLAAALALILSVLCASCGRPEDEIDSEKTKQEAQEPLRVLVAGRDRASGLCDVLMLVSAEPQEGSVQILQLPRDTFAVYDSGSYCKLNGAMQSLGGMEELCEYLSDCFGLPIERYLCVELDVLQKAVDAVGGVEVTLSEPMTYRDPVQGLVIDLPAGTQTLDGKAAEQFVRYRAGYENGDLGRMDAQQQFLAAFFRTLRQKADLTLLFRLALLALDDADTDLNLGELISFGKLALQVREEAVLCVRLPGVGATVRASGASYYVLSHPATEELLVALFGAVPDSFDREERFCHHRNEEFSRLYAQYAEYQVHRMSQIAS